MAKGLPKSIIKKYGVTKKAWRIFKGKRRKSKRTRTSNPKKRRVRRIGRRRKGSRRYSMTIPLAPVAGILAGMIDPINEALAGNYPRAMEVVVQRYTGYNVTDGTWNVGNLLKGVGPLIAGLLVHKFVGGPPLNFNKMLGRAKVPFIRI